MNEPEPEDPRFEWHELSNLAGHVTWVRGRCNHIFVVPVESGGEEVARLCLDCDYQLPAHWSR